MSIVIKVTFDFIPLRWVYKPTGVSGPYFDSQDWKPFKDDHGVDQGSLKIREKLVEG